MPAITVVCPECDKEMRAPADVEGKKIRCKGCGAAFVARVEEDEEDEAPRKKPAKKPAAKKPEPKKAEPKPAAKKGDDDDDPNPYGLTFEDLSNRCPECANQMESEDAVICLHCGFNVQTRERSRTRKVRDVTGLTVFLWLLPGILSALAVVLMITWIIIHWGPLAYWLGIDPEKDKETWIFMLVALPTKIWTTVPLGFLIFSAGYFAINRLAINNKPPEIEERMKK